MRLRHWVFQCPICHAWPVRQRELPWCMNCEQTWQLLPSKTPLDPRLSAVIQGHSCALSFDWPWKHPIGRFKLKQDLGWSLAWGQLMGQVLLNDHPQAAQWNWIGMPQTPARWAQRGGYDPVALLVNSTRHWLQHQGMTTGPWLRHTLSKKPLVNVAQHHLSRHERWRAVNEAFVGRRPEHSLPSQANTHALLVDDILTTGATLTAAATALAKVGYTHIWALTLARTPAPRVPNHGQFGTFRDHHVSYRSGST